MFNDGRVYLKSSKNLEACSIKIFPTVSYIVKDNERLERMNCTIKNNIQKLMIQACVQKSFWMGFLYGVYSAPNWLPRPGCPKTLEKQLAIVNLIVLHLHGSAAQFQHDVSDKMRKALDAKARSGGLLQIISYGKFCIMLKDSQDVETSHRGLAREDVFGMRHW